MIPQEKDKVKLEALRYTELGWQVFPLQHRSKMPRKALGVYNATTDADQIARWWSMWPQANVGLHCGGSGLVALDFDGYKENYDGADLMTKADEQTVTSLTGSGGTHLIFRMPEGAKYGNSTRGLPAGVDVRGVGGYIVLPPSIHPNGREYAWESGYSPFEVDVLPLPTGLRELLDSAHVARRPLNQYATPESLQSLRFVAESVMDKLGIESDGAKPYSGLGGEGLRWILRQCPFAPADNPHGFDGSAYIIVLQGDDSPIAGCHHARCRAYLESRKQSGWSHLLGQYHLKGRA